MNESGIVTKLKFIYTVYAVMFGTDDTLLKIKLNDGFSFVRKSLMPLKDHLDKIFEVDGMELRREYETARVDKNSLDVICAIKQFTIELNPSQAGNFFHEATERNLISLDNQIRAIRLLHECSLRCNKMSFRLCSEKYILNSIDMQINYNEIFPIYESMGTKTVTRFHCDNDLSKIINNRLPFTLFPIVDKTLNSCHLYYDLSYHQDNYISITLLTVALEMLYLEKENARKEKLAKRCSAYPYEEKEARSTCYQRLLYLYKKRSEFVHEGIFDSINNEDIIFLRKCVRMSLLGMIFDNKSKKARISDIKIVISSLDY